MLKMEASKAEKEAIRIFMVNATTCSENSGLY